MQKERNLIFHPFILCTLPILVLFSLNAHEVPLMDILIPIGISLIISFSAWIILRYFLSGIKAGNIVSLIFLLFLIYGNLHTFLQNSEDSTIQIFGSNLILGTIFLIIGVLGIRFFLKTNQNYQINSIFNVVAITIILILSANVVIYFVNNPVNETEEYFGNISIIEKNVNEKPDVFLFILDEFAGKYQLKMDFDYNLNTFNQNLKDRGFSVPNVALSNYPNTAFSMPSLLNMDYLDFLTEEFDEESKDMRIPTKLRNQNNVMKIFQTNGYSITTFYAGLDATGDARIVDEKLCSNGTINADLRKNFVLTYMPITYFNDKLLANFQFDKLECAFSYIHNFKTNESQPKYIHAHLRLPHHPFTYDSEGNYISDEIKESDKNAYLEQLKFTEKKILELIDEIKNHSPNAVIIVLSDHGYRPEINWEDPTDKDLVRGFNVITAIYFPERDVILDENISLVNVFRIFFNEYFDYELEILPDRQIWYNPQKPYVHTDVSKKLNLEI